MSKWGQVSKYSIITHFDLVPPGTFATHAMGVIIAKAFGRVDNNGWGCSMYWSPSAVGEAVQSCARVPHGCSKGPLTYTVPNPLTPYPLRVRVNTEPGCCVYTVGVTHDGCCPMVGIQPSARLPTPRDCSAHIN